MRKFFNANQRFAGLVFPILVFGLISGCKEKGATNMPNESGNKIENSESRQESTNEAAPWVLNIEQTTLNNPHYRIEQWTGKNLQMVLMSIEPGSEIDLELHEGHDQFIRIEQGQARVLMGKTENELSFDQTVSDDWAIFIPAGYFHQIKNTGDNDLKIYTIYAPAEHEPGTLHKTYEEGRDH